MPSENVTHRLVMSTLFLLTAGAVVVAVMLTSAQASSEVPGNSPSPTMSGDMPGMNHGLAEVGRSTGVGRSVG